MGIPPIPYLTHWRLALAAHALRSGGLSLTGIAEKVVYESEAAFSRAFRVHQTYQRARGGEAQAQTHSS